jgi:hypothetical protein
MVCLLSLWTVGKSLGKGKNAHEPRILEICGKAYEQDSSIAR